MKPAATISLVVLAVLATVVIEEMRIKKLHAELLRLRSIPTNQPISITPQKIFSQETPLPATRREKSAPSMRSEGKPIAMPTIPWHEEASGHAKMELPGLRKVPKGHPKPSAEEIKQAALGPYSALHYELGLSNHERVYFDFLLGKRRAKQQELVQTWVAASNNARREIEKKMASEIARSDEMVRAFLQSDKDFEQFVSYHAMQTERMRVAQLLPLMDQQGMPLEMADEQKLIAAMHEARIAVQGIDWDSPEVLQVVVAGNAKDRFEKEWADRTEGLAAKLPEFLDEKTAEVVLSSREQLKKGMDEALDSMIEAIHGETMKPASD